MTRHTASVATDDESLDGLVIVDDIQTTHVPGISHRLCFDAINFDYFHRVSSFLKTLSLLQAARLVCLSVCLSLARCVAFSSFQDCTCIRCRVKTVDVATVGVSGL